MGNAREKQTAPFKVGDRVEIVGYGAVPGVGNSYPIGTRGTVSVADMNSEGYIYCDFISRSGNLIRLGTDPALLRKVEDAPVKVVYDSPDYARSLEQEIVRLTAEVAEAEDHLQTVIKNEEGRLQEEIRRAESAEGKLEDIAALIRAGLIIHVIGIESPIAKGIKDVLGRAA